VILRNSSVVSIIAFAVVEFNQECAGYQQQLLAWCSLLPCYYWYCYFICSFSYFVLL